MGKEVKNYLPSLQNFPIAKPKQTKKNYGVECPLPYISSLMKISSYEEV
jgi:hypothetical protein